MIVTDIKYVLLQEGNKGEGKFKDQSTFNIEVFEWLHNNLCLAERTKTVEEEVACNLKLQDHGVNNRIWHQTRIRRKEIEMDLVLKQVKLGIGLCIG
uniref:Uncharacterized protein n=1 Tax=Oryza sativa subsp. japonica TaxID=39947 RepID=Q9LWZ4_ORYSJ|nr:hypothetical protein [Oryza sativa Japonica Group]